MVSCCVLVFAEFSTWSKRLLLHVTSQKEEKKKKKKREMENDKQNKEKEISYLMSGKYIFLFSFFSVIDKDNFVKEKLLKIQTPSRISFVMNHD
jgi:ATP adenylyltransferase/5',5'''-P-1,P-4-tetraphosphate phosphorylase II